MATLEGSEVLRALWKQADALEAKHEAELAETTSLLVKLGVRNKPKLTHAGLWSVRYLGTSYFGATGEKLVEVVRAVVVAQAKGGAK